MGPDVFLSHSSEDQAVAERIREFLEAQGVGCWIASRNGLPGDEPDESVSRGIAASRVMVLVFSKSADESESVLRDVERALHAHKVLIPFRIENVPPTGALEQQIGRRYSIEAYSPPLERHLEGLARMLKTLTHKRASTPAQEASISRTLPSRSSIVRRSDVHASSATAETKGPLRLSFDFNRVLVAGRVSSFQLLVQNQGPCVLDELEVTMESRAIERILSNNWAELAPRAEQSHSFEFKPIRSGHFVLHVTAQWRQGAKKLVFAGSRSLRINETPAKSDLANGMKNLLGNSEKSATPGGGEPALAQLVASGVFPTLHDLLDFELPENFEPLELGLDYEVDTRAQEQAAAHRPLEIPAAFLDRAQAGTMLKLESVGASRPSSQPEIRLVSRASFSLGRSREESDFLTWFWPRNEVHDTKTRRISKKHCALTSKRGKFYVGNTAAASLTTFDDQEVSGVEDVTLERRGMLNLSGIYFVDVTRFPANASQGPTISNLGHWKGLGATAVAIGSGSVRFVPKTPHHYPQNVTWLLTDGTFGTSRANPIVLELKGLAEIQGRFHHYLDSFWIENAVENGAVEVDGVPLACDSIIPLVDGQLLKLGLDSFRLTVTT